jgi:hypothetical protein
VPALRLVDLSQPAQCRDNVDSITVAEGTRHPTDPASCSVFGGRLVGHVIDDDGGCHATATVMVTGSRQAAVVVTIAMIRPPSSRSIVCTFGAE